MKRILYFMFIGAILIGWQHAIAQTTASWIERGDSLQRQEVYAEAVKAYTAAIKLDPDCADAYLKRGVARFLAKKTNCTEALSDLTEAIRLAPTNAEAYYQRGIINYYLLNNEQGRKDMEAAAGLGHPQAGTWLRAKTAAGGGEAASEQAVIYFDHDRADIKAVYRPLLEGIGALMKEKPFPIAVSGHADSTGTDEYNQVLSFRRADAVKKFLTENARISPGRIIVRAYGERVPAASNDTEEGRAANRRAEITGITTTSDSPESRER